MLIALSGFFLTILVIYLLKKAALRYKVLVAKGIPRIGGIGMALSFGFVAWLGSVISYGSVPEATGIILAAYIMLVFGIIDDIRELSVFLKFLVQVIAAALLVFLGVETKIIYIGNFANILITIIWVIGITNAFNLLDVTDGLAAGAAIIVSSSFFIIALFTGNIQAAILLASLLGAACGFLIYNFPPAKIYMGNSGSHFLGFIFSAIAITLSYAPIDRKIALLSPLLILGFPIFDTLFLVLVRLKQKKPVFNKSGDHLVMRFLQIGHSKRKALLLMLAFCLFFSSCGVIVSRVSNVQAAAVILFVVLTGVLLFIRMKQVKIDA